MPEYLAPGVYVEEIDTGSKPIEGVSTSTAGMVGVAERGPVNVPILITGVAEYQRWFGGHLRADDFPDEDRTRPRRFLPHAVEGFFTNGGKRVYVVRVLDTALAQPARAVLFDRGATAAVDTRLLGRAAAGTAIYVAASASLAVGDWLQIGAGGDAEYAQIQAPPAAANDVTLRLPLAFAHRQGTTVEHFAPFGAPAGTVTLDQGAAAGARQLHVSGPGAIAAGTILRLGTAGADEEFVIADSVDAAAPVPRTVTLRTPVLLAHPAGANAVARMPALPAAPADTTTLGTATAAGDSALFLANRTGFAAGEIARVSDGNATELRVVGAPAALRLTLPAYADYPAGATVEAVTLNDDAAATTKTLTRDVAAGGKVLDLDDRQGLNAGDVVRVGQAADPDVEFVRIEGIANRQPGADAGKVALSFALARSHPQGAEVRRQTMPVPRAAAAPVGVALPARRGDQTIVAGGSAGFAAGTAIRVVAGGTVAYHQLAAAPAAQTPAPVTLDPTLTRPHPAGAPVVARTPLLLIQALDAGGWGNRLRVAVQDHDQGLVQTRLREVVDATHLRLDSPTGVEAGTILEHTDASGARTQVKVRSIDRPNRSLIELEAGTPLPFGAGQGDLIRSREFQLDVFLLRQADPAVPTRGETILDTESYRYLSLDPRHSRYVHRVIGTTWDLAAATVNEDFDRRPLRREDRRSEGESRYIRVRDLAHDLAEPNRTTTLESIRLGPDPLLETLPSGATRPARRPLAQGDDGVGGITDDLYRGQDDPEPERRSGLASLRNEDEIAIVALPGRTSPALQGALVAHCELMRYRFAVLDGPPPPADSLNDVQSQRQQFDSKYAALYHPWLLIPDPYPTNLATVANYPIPPSGHVAGIYARTDVERGVHKAPANEVVRGAIGLRRALNKGEQDILNPFPVNINVIRDFRLDNRGIRVYGGRVITSDPDWKYVNVRRLLIFIENSLDRGLQWVVFEPNAEPLWARVRRSITAFLTVVWRNGALEGTRREEAFFVKCDRTTMTQADIDNGRLIVIVGVAPVKPAEFVIVRIGLWTAHAEEE